MTQQLARTKLNEVDAPQTYYNRSQEMSKKLEHAVEQLSPPLLNAMMLNFSGDCHKHTVQQENFNPSGSLVELRRGLMFYEGSCRHKEGENDVD